MLKAGNSTQKLLAIVAALALLTALLVYSRAIPTSYTLIPLILVLTTVVSATTTIVATLFIKKASHNRSDATQHQLFDSMAEAILIFDENGALEYANASALSIIRKEKESVLGKAYTEVLPLFSDSGDSIYLGPGGDPINKAKQEGKRKQLRNLQLYFDEETVYLNVSINPLPGISDSDQKALVLMEDITEEQALEKMKLDFVAMAAHELRTPMTSIRGYLELLLNETEYYLQPVHHKFLENALLASDRLVNLMSNLLSVSQIERHKIKLNLIPVNINDIIEKTMESFRPDAKEKNLKFAYIRPPGEVPKIKGDPKYVKQVIDNLVSNAISYTAKGSVTVTLHFQPGGRQVTVSIKDTGQGIPVEALPHMFEKFYRVSSLLEQGSKGTGLGLYIAKKLIEMQGGRIWVESVEGKGTIFSFALPVYSSDNEKDESHKK